MKKLSWILVSLLLVWVPAPGVSASTSQSEGLSTWQSSAVPVGAAQNQALGHLATEDTVARLAADVPTVATKVTNDGTAADRATDAATETTGIMDDDITADMVDDPADTSDPLESLNRVFFKFNDLFYFGILRPVSSVYAAVVPELGRVGVRNFFHNLAAPKHFLSALLQGKVQQSSVELGRFGINTLLGGLGLVDVAGYYGMKSAEEDIGQVLGRYGAGDGVYLVWPVLGPSNLRDSIGWVGDTLLDPLSHVPDEVWGRAGAFAFKTANETSLHLGEYEDLKKAAFDPYISLRDAYLQKRAAQIQD